MPASIGRSTTVPNITVLTKEQAETINATADPAGLDGSLRPWDKQAGEDIDWYERFLYYLRLGPDRSMNEACRQYLTHKGKLLPGEPVPVYIIYAWYQESVRWQWLFRARHWDRENLHDLQVAIEQERQKRIQSMAEEHIAGWEMFQRAAVLSVYQRDEAGNLLLDEDGQPRLKEIEDVGTAARVFDRATKGKRVEMGLPTELLALSGPELIRRYKELSNLQSEEEPIDGEVTELE